MSVSIEQPERRGAVRAFGAILHRDIAVTGRDLPAFVAQVVLQPMFHLLVFGKVLTVLGYAGNGYERVLFPGIVALTAVLTAIQSTSLSLVAELSYTMEIEDRLMAPLPTPLVAVEKIVFASLRALVAVAVMFPVGRLVLGSIPWRDGGAALAIASVVLGALVGSAIGLVMGTYVPPHQIPTVFAVVLTPILFAGACQYPWPSLSRIAWFKVVAACNPLTYVSEGLRGALVPGVPHIPGWVCVLVLVAFVACLSAIGIRGFNRRVIT